MPRIITYEFIRESLEKEGYKLLSKKYINAHQKLDYICQNGHRHNINWNNWQQGQRCPYCAGNAKVDIKFIKSEFEKENYHLLIRKYKNNLQKLKYKCPRRHEYYISWANWQNGKRCPVCSGYFRKNYEYIKLQFKSEGYELLSKIYINAKQKLECLCPKGHRCKISWDTWHRGHRCLYCINTVSKGEIEIRNFVRSLVIKVFANYRNIIFNPFTNYPFELDIFMPDLNKAIEYNGEYWHKEKKGKINNDVLKQQLCKEKGIYLLTIWDKEWLSNNERCKNKIKEFIMEV